MRGERTAGSGGKGDCLVTVRAGDGLSVRVTTKSPRMLEDGVSEVVTETLERLGAGDLEVEISDQGALDYVIAGRVEAAVREGAEGDLNSIAPTVDRTPSTRGRPRRSRLYAPGNQPRVLVGIDIHGADCVLLDLEDSVPPAEKAAARILVKHLLGTIRFPGEVWVRINPLDICGREDVEEVLLGRPHGVCLPKAESATDVVALSELLSHVESTCGIEEGTTWIMPILETGHGVLDAEEIAGADSRVAALAFGAEDYTRDVGARRTWDSLLFARSRIVAAAAAAEVQASDTVYADVDDDAGLTEECERARALGFDGKGAINPRQLPTIHAAFSPTEAELERARAVVEAARYAEEQGLGVVALDGKMIDRPVLDRAVRMIEFADRLTGRVDQDA